MSPVHADDRAWANPGCDKCEAPAIHAMACTCSKGRHGTIVYRRCAGCGGRKACLRQLSAHWTYANCARGSIGIDEAVAP